MDFSFKLCCGANVWPVQRAIQEVCDGVVNGSEVESASPKIGRECLADFGHVTHRERVQSFILISVQRPFHEHPTNVRHMESTVPYGVVWTR